MAEIRFSKDDGPIRVRLGDHDALIQGAGAIRYLRVSGFRANTPTGPHRRRIMVVLEAVTKISTLVSLVAMVALWLWYWRNGAGMPSFVSVGAKAVSVAFLGSLLSYGGISIVSLRTQSAAALQQAAAVRREACPFVALVAENAHQRPGNPDFCVTCPLAVETTGAVDQGFLLHNCTVYGEMHSQWRELHDRDQTSIHRPVDSHLPMES